MASEFPVLPVASVFTYKLDFSPVQQQIIWEILVFLNFFCLKTV